MTPMTTAVRSYVAFQCGGGRSVFHVLGDRYVADRLDEHPSLRDELAPRMSGVLPAGPSG